MQFSPEHSAVYDLCWYVQNFDTKLRNDRVGSCCDKRTWPVLSFFGRLHSQSLKNASFASIIFLYTHLLLDTVIALKASLKKAVERWRHVETTQRSLAITRTRRTKVNRTKQRVHITSRYRGIDHVDEEEKRILCTSFTVLSSRQKRIRVGTSKDVSSSN